MYTNNAIKETEASLKYYQDSLKAITENKDKINNLIGAVHLAFAKNPNYKGARLKVKDTRISYAKETHFEDKYAIEIIIHIDGYKRISTRQHLNLLKHLASSARNEGANWATQYNEFSFGAGTYFFRLDAMNGEYFPNHEEA